MFRESHSEAMMYQPRLAGPGDGHVNVWGQRTPQKGTTNTEGLKWAPAGVSKEWKEVDVAAEWYVGRSDWG